jgi:hypothetical protein
MYTWERGAGLGMVAAVFVSLFDYLSRFSLELCRLLSNGQNFPLIGKVAYASYTIEKCVFRKYINTWVTSLVGLLQPLVPLFDCLIRSSLELCRLLCNDQNFPLIGKEAYTDCTILWKYG